MATPSTPATPLTPSTPVAAAPAAEPKVEPKVEVPVHNNYQKAHLGTSRSPLCLIITWRI